MAEVNFGKVFGTLSKVEENRCQIDELISSFVCENPATQTIKINGYYNEAWDLLDAETISICEDCKASI